MLTEPSQMSIRSGEGEQQRLAPLRKPQRGQSASISLVCCSQVLRVHDSFVNARMCSPSRALIRFAQRSTIQRDGSGHHTSVVWYNQPHYLSKIIAQPVEKPKGVVVRNERGRSLCEEGKR